LFKSIIKIKNNLILHYGINLIGKVTSIQKK
jgi:hypothetical protein